MVEIVHTHIYIYIYIQSQVINVKQTVMIFISVIRVIHLYVWFRIILHIFCKNELLKNTTTKYE